MLLLRCTRSVSTLVQRDSSGCRCDHEGQDKGANLLSAFTADVSTEVMDRQMMGAAVP